MLLLSPCSPNCSSLLLMFAYFLRYPVSWSHGGRQNVLTKGLETILLSAKCVDFSNLLGLSVSTLGLGFRFTPTLTLGWAYLSGKLTWLGWINWISQLLLSVRCVYLQGAPMPKSESVLYNYQINLRYIPLRLMTYL